MSTAKDPTTLASPDSWAANLKPGDMISENKTQIHHLVICKRGNFIDHCKADGFSETRVDWLEANYQFERSGNPNSFLTENDDLLQFQLNGLTVCGGVKFDQIYRHKLDRTDLCKVEDVLVKSTIAFVRFKSIGSKEIGQLNMSLFKNTYIPVSIVDIETTATP